MALTESFKDAVRKNDIMKVRIMIKNSLITSPAIEDINERISFAEENLLELYDEHNGEKFNKNLDTWTEEYMDEEMIELIYNFSKERLIFLKEMSKKFYVKEKNKQSSEKNIFNRKKEIGVGAVVSGVAATTAGVIAAKTVVVAAGLGVMLVGGVLIISEISER